MKRLSALITVALLLHFGTYAQYCSPTFANGCATWRVISATIGSSVDWTSSDCYNSDQTALMAEANLVDSVPMTVTTGVWSGCSVWVDWDQNDVFDTTENVYHQYVGGDPSYTYSFNIGVPPGTALGQYRLRIIGAWGSDGYSNGSANGFGPCGSFQYGSFDDFTLDVTTSTSISAHGARRAAITASPNPTTGMVTLNLGNSTAKDIIALESMDGRLVRQMNSTGATTMYIDLGDVPAGIYFIRNMSDASARPLRIVKQ